MLMKIKSSSFLVFMNALVAQSFIELSMVRFVSCLLKTRVKAQLEALAAKYPDKVKEVRGRGLILGMELAKEGKAVVETCLREHVIVNCTAGNVIRLVPPLIVTKEEIDTVIKALDVALAEF